MNEPEEGHILSKGVRDVLRRLQRRPEDQAHTVRVYPFHHQYPGTEQLYHVTCEQHPEFGFCGEAREASTVAKAHSAESLQATACCEHAKCPGGALCCCRPCDECTPTGRCARHTIWRDREPVDGEVQRLRAVIAKVQDALDRHDESDSGSLGLFHLQVSDALEEAGL